MNRKGIILFALMLVLATDLFAQVAGNNTLSKQEKKEGWKLLFDGKTTEGWRNYKSDKIGPAWQVKGGELFVDVSNKLNGMIVGGGSIITKEQFGNFELSIDWKIEPCGNSGIMFYVVEEGQGAEVWNTGPEMQILDNTCHPDAKFPKHRAGNLYDLIASPTESVKPAGEWNTARIISDNGHLVLWLNDIKQVDTQMFTSEWDALIAGSKFKDIPVFCKTRHGYISLQDHDNQVWFRNIKIRKLG